MALVNRLGTKYPVPIVHGSVQVVHPDVNRGQPAQGPRDVEGGIGRLGGNVPDVEQDPRRQDGIKETLPPSPAAQDGGSGGLHRQSIAEALVEDILTS